MKKTTCTEEQIAFALHQAQTRTSVADICRKLGVSEQTFYRWKKKFAGMGIAAYTCCLAVKAGASTINGCIGFSIRKACRCGSRHARSG